METMKQYVIRRAIEHKQYRIVAEECDVGAEWLRKLAHNLIGKPNVDAVEKLWRYYKLHETRQKRRAA